MKRRLIRAAKRALRAYLGFWATLVLRVRRPVIIGVTGTVGKTTTKEVIAAVLSHPDARKIIGTVRKSPGNLNDNLGQPLSILGFADWQSSNWQLAAWLALAPAYALKLAFFGSYADVLVLEYALSSDSDFSLLIKVARPKVAVVTAVGPAHLDTFGTVERIAHEKGALVRAVPADGLVVLGSENPFVSEMASQAWARVVSVGGVGRALSDDIARAVGRFCGLPDQTIEDGIKRQRAVWRRLKFHDLAVFTYIDDTINANPMSMRLALKTLAERASGSQRKVALLGYMAELGADSPFYHREIGVFARQCADLVVGVGPAARDYAADCWFANASECGDGLRAILRPGDLVLVKGSASAQMDFVTAALKRLGEDWSGVAA